MAAVLDALVAAGYGTDPVELASRYTMRQIRRFYQLAEARRNRHRADLIEAVNVGFSGGNTLTQTIRKLRGG